MFGVVVDTSGSMSPELLGMALGSIASYGAAREVPLVRVIFCDARAYDAGYLAPEEIAGRVQVKGRGGGRFCSRESIFWSRQKTFRIMSDPYYHGRVD